MKQKTLFIVIGCAVALAATGAGTLWALTHSAKFAGKIFEQAVTADEAAPVAAIAPRVLGIDSPNTVLLLFLNNAELRPGGGFLGSYGLVTFDHGIPKNLKIEGTEKLDESAPASFVVAPPEAMRVYLQQPRWFFRDANWSPDFVISAQRALQFYAAEGGDRAQDIHTVIGITPEVLSTILKYTGPITVRGTTFTAETIADALEYSVEVEFTHKQIPTSERKAILSELGGALAKRMATISPSAWGNIMQDLFTLAAERHIMMYDIDPAVQRSIDALDLSGRQQPGIPDKIQIVDANLAALKTDRVINRSADVRLEQNKSGAWEETITISYEHTGGFDYRTTRYRSYMRVYVPDEATFIGGEGAMQQDKSNKPGDFSVTHEEGNLVIGGFVSVEPGSTKTITMRFAPSPAVLRAIAARNYGLLVQKQLGLEQFHLTLHVDFGTSIRRASPAEDPKNFGDNAYDWSGMITHDSRFIMSW